MAAAAAAGSLGFAALRPGTTVAGVNQVELPLENSEAITDSLSLDQELTFEKEGVKLVFGRDAGGRMSLKVSGEGKSEAELEAIGRQMADGVTRQYAYHRLMTEIKDRNFNVVSERVEADGTVRLRVRTFQGG
ncbi:MAG: DUF1257 domain-containing protein [Desulfobacterales bacterium]|nr:DUF1257 domain-containing protein [Desulfobacterales bacterium]